MKHPEALLVPVLMFSDYFLTVYGAIQRDKGYSGHIKTQHYELNPVFQKAIAKKKWFNPRHTLLTIVFSGLVIGQANYPIFPEAITLGILGYFIIFFGTLVGRHLSNILIFNYRRRNPNAIQGQVKMSHQMVLANSSYTLVSVLVPVALIAVCSGSAFAYGGFLGIIQLLSRHLSWQRKAQDKITPNVSPPPFVKKDEAEVSGLPPIPPPFSPEKNPGGG